MTLRELLEDQGIDPDKLLSQVVAKKFDDGGGISASLGSGRLEISIIAPANLATPSPETKDKPAKPKRQR